MGGTRFGGGFAAAIGLVLVLGLVVGAPVGSGAAAAPATSLAADAAPGGPILVVTATGNKFTRYLAEILQAEGLNAYATADVSALNATLLADYDVVVLGEMALTAGAGDDAHRLGQRRREPDRHAARRAALRPARRHDSGGGVRKDHTSSSRRAPAGAGIVTDSIQFHGTADRYTLAGATAVASFYATPTTIDRRTRRSRCARVGSAGGQAAAFAFDLARSVVYTRQGNPAWAGQERDGVAPIRADDLFFGAKAGDPQPDWVDLNKVADPAGRRAAAAAGEPDHAHGAATSCRCRASGTSRATRRRSSS